MRSLGFLSFLALLIFAKGCWAQNSTPSVDQIIGRMTETYASASSYQDSGTIVVLKGNRVVQGQELLDLLVANDFEKEGRVTFNFAFRRSEHLRFEWKNKQSKVNRQPVVWSNSKGAFSWGTVLDEPDASFIFDKEKSLKWAVDEQTRGSMGVADLLFNALEGSKESYSFSKMTNSQVIRNETISGNECFVILGNIGNQPWVLWIDSKNYLLRRYRTTIATGSFGDAVANGYMPFTFGEFNHNDIVLNTSIPDSLFDFKPELRKGDSDISNYEDDGSRPPALPPLPKKPND